MKKTIYAIVATVIIFMQNISTFGAQWDNRAPIYDDGLPGSKITDASKAIETISSNIIAELIKYVAVFAVIALMISWVMYMLSSGDEEKTKKARTWIIWSIVAVALSISAYFIVNTLNEFNI